MKTMRVFPCRRLAICLLALGLAPSAGSADVLRWHVTNLSPYRAQIDFYSEDRPHEWPGGGKAWPLEDYGSHTYNLECRTHEHICYGAWIPNHAEYYWGSGGNHDQKCKNCCAYCGEGDVTIKLQQ